MLQNMFHKKITFCTVAYFSIVEVAWVIESSYTTKLKNPLAYMYDL